MGTVFVFPGNPIAKVWGVLQKVIKGGDSITNIAQICFNAIKWLALAAIIISVGCDCGNCCRGDVIKKRVYFGA
ncbi:MAG: hypothetical protein IKT33_00275 [Clostridia bacterium]|nr:hypothetical protein [Clostridia bacterium]